MSYSATTLVYARTPGGVVQVDEEGTLPEDVDDQHLEVLLAAGAVAKTKPVAKGRSRG